jgi:hypothetical protein
MVCQERVTGEVDLGISGNELYLGNPGAQIDLVVYLRVGMRRGFTNRRCPKCNGNLFIEESIYPELGADCHRWYEWCLQCGYQHNLQSTTALAEEFEAIQATEETVSV